MELQITSCAWRSHLSVECESAIWWYKCRKVKAVMALDLKSSFSATIFSMRPRSDTVNRHCPMRMSSSVGVRSHSSSVTLAAMWRQLRLTQDRCLGWIWGWMTYDYKTRSENGWSESIMFCSLHRCVIQEGTEQRRK